MSTTLHPYLNFAGRTEEAMRFYDAALFFGRFGMLVDRFGISWMLHYAPPPSEG